MKNTIGSKDECPNFGHLDDAGNVGGDQAMEGSGQLITMQEAAKMLKIGVRTLYRYLDRGRISRSYRLPGRRLLDRADVLAFLEKCADERTS